MSQESSVKVEQIKASELRIGNYWMPEWSKEIRQADWIDIRDIAEGRLIGAALAIPLSTDWLERFGFEKSVEHTWSFGYDKEYKVYRKGEFTYNEIQAAWWYHGLLSHQPHYVHTLQNLYYALTGSELTIKETV